MIYEPVLLIDWLRYGGYGCSSEGGSTLMRGVIKDLPLAPGCVE